VSHRTRWGGGLARHCARVLRGDPSDRAPVLARRRLSLAALAALAGGGTGAARAAEPPRRLALVVGNARYEHGPLRNALNDARQMGAALRALGFAVTVKENLGWDGMVGALASFSQQARRSDVRLFYYAGHGMQVHGTNYLTPIGAAAASEHELRARSIDVDELVERLGRLPDGIGLVIVDACRSNPLTRVLRPTRSPPSAGLAPTSAPRGMVVAYSTGPNSAALDGAGGGNSVYTRHLLAEMQMPGRTVEQVFKRVHAAVEAETQRAQRPWLSTSLSGDYCFRPLAGGRCSDK